jgi:hypothetical protein
MLNVSHNQIAEIGDEVLGLRSLVKLSVSHNKLHALSLYMLRLPHLQAVSFHHNAFTPRERIVRRAVPSLRELAALKLLAMTDVKPACLPLPVELKELLCSGGRCAVCPRPFYQQSCVEKIALRPWKNHQDVPFIELFCSFECAMGTV